MCLSEQDRCGLCLQFVLVTSTSYSGDGLCPVLFVTIVLDSTFADPPSSHSAHVQACPKAREKNQWVR